VKVDQSRYEPPIMERVCCCEFHAIASAHGQFVGDGENLVERGALVKVLHQIAVDVVVPESQDQRPRSSRCKDCGKWKRTDV